MKIDFTKDKHEIRDQILDFWGKHIEMIKSHEFPGKGGETMYYIGALDTLGCLLEEMLGVGDSYDTRGETELAAEPGQGDDQPKGTGAD